MIIICGQCQTKFRVNTGLIKETGTRVRCSNCQAVFTVFAPTAREEQERRDRLVGASEQAGGRRGTSDLDSELNDYFQGADSLEEPDRRSSGPDPNRGPEVRTGPDGRPVLSAVPQKRAQNNPINMIKGNGDNFIVPEATMLLRPTQDLQAYPASAAPSSGPGLPALGLEADPVGPPVPAEPGGFGVMPDGDYGARAQGAPAQPPLRAPKKGFTRRQKVLLLVLSVAAALLVVFTLFLSQGRSVLDNLDSPAGAPDRRVQEASDALAERQPQAGDPPDNQVETVPDDDGIIRITFIQDQTAHHYIQNSEAGTLLVLTGLVQNNDTKPVSYIRLKGMLTDSQEKVVAERQIFAGNFLTEEELRTLPMRDILSRLSLRAGQNGTNVNVPPSQTLPYMVVFDRLPADLGKYLLEPVGYTDAGEAPPST
ncbi:MAG: zinc-ribbon domain-containing protein [Deltaproteobacteria bacterium]|jgi:predicted Zn finger-like uncharacterized protein|nr:zinc-ribbon domain-containing protein [Deltaproteobacteria bacterium]